ncbi:flagellar biosynthesis anti-sigma factor FlgM [Thermaurantiacus sp.]
MVDGVKGKGQLFQRVAGSDSARTVGSAGSTAPVRQAVPAGRLPLADGREAFDLSGIKGLARDLAIRPPVDAQRIADVRLAIAAGTYKPDAESIAAAMIAEEVSWLASRGS